MSVYIDVTNIDEWLSHFWRTFRGIPLTTAFTANVCLNLWAWIFIKKFIMHPDLVSNFM
nr:hypothetical protein [Caldisphaera sp.]